MDDSEKKRDLGIRRLSLIDVASEDDCLFNSPSGFPLDLQFSENQEDGSVESLESVDANNIESLVDALEEREQVPQLLESLEPKRTRKNGKCNLRNSLAWDSAFFTSAGVLDPDELCSMMGSPENGEKHLLPGIQEDIHKSTDSLSTLQSDTLTLDSLEADLFEDIRASIQKSTKASNVANSSSRVRSAITETQTIRTSKVVDLASRNKMKPKAAPKKSSVGTQGSGKTMKQVSGCSQVSQSISRNGESSLCKPPKVLGRVSPISSLTKRASLGANHVKMEKDNAINATGRRAQVSRLTALGASRNNVPKPTIPSKSSLGSSSVPKKEPTTSHSSFDSSDSASSDSIGKSSLNFTKIKGNARTGNPSSGSTVKTPSRIGSRHKNQSGSSHLSPYVMPVTNHSSSVSPASSISEWSLESSSSASTIKQTSNGSRASLDTNSCKRFSVDSDAPHVLDSQKDSKDQCSIRHDTQVTGLLGECVKRALPGTGALLRPASMKPSGLRMPSPKIGFFDGVRMAARTPNGSMQAHPGVPNGFPKFGVKSVSPSGASNKAKLGKLQPARTITVMRDTKLDHQTALSIKPRSPLPLEEPSNVSTKISSASRNVKTCPGISPTVQYRMPSKTSGKSYLKAVEVGSEDQNPAIDDPDFCFAENYKDLGVLKDKVSAESKGITLVEDITTPPINGPSTTGDSRSMFDAKDIPLSQKVGEDIMLDQHYLKNDLHLYYKTNEKEKANFEDQVDILTKQVGAEDINMEIQKELIGGPELSFPSELLVCGQKEESMNSLSRPTLSDSPTTFEITDSTRIPLAVKDSFCNRDGSFDVSTGLTMEEEKKTTSPFQDIILKENSEDIGV